MRCFCATIEVETSICRNLKGRILDSIYSWDPRKRPRVDTTGSLDVDILTALEEETSVRLTTSPREERKGCH